MLIKFILIAILLAVVVSSLSFTRKDWQLLFGPRQKFDHNGSTRTYRVIKPGSEVDKIVLVLHGFGGSGLQTGYFTALHNTTDDQTLIVYPDAVEPNRKDLRTGWNAGFCCGSGFVNETYDVDFLLKLVDKLKSDYAPGINPKAFVVGFSNGAFMSQRLAAEQPDSFDGAVAISGTIGTTSKRITPTKPIPMLLINGEQDKTIPIEGGPGGDPNFKWLSFKETSEAWLQNNKDAAPTKIVRLPNEKHVFSTWRIADFWNKRPSTSQEIIDFIDKISN